MKSRLAKQGLSNIQESRWPTGTRSHLGATQDYSLLVAVFTQASVLWVTRP